VNEKQAKLLRYFSKHTGDIKLAAITQAAWDRMPAKAKGRVTTWMKKVIVTMMAVDKAKRVEIVRQNKATLEKMFQ
jgi:hypothetical protein